MPRTKQFNEAEVLEKAKNLFWKQGFHATSVQDLVNHLGINRASIYDTFGGKNQLYEAALLAYREENFDYLKKRLASFDSIKKGFHQLFSEAVKESLEDRDKKGCFVVNCTTEYLPKHAHILVDLLDNKANFQQIVAQTLQRGIDEKEFDKSLDTQATAAYLYTFFSGLKVISKVEKNHQQIEKIITIGLAVL